LEIAPSIQFKFPSSPVNRRRRSQLASSVVAVSDAVRPALDARGWLVRRGNWGTRASRRREHLQAPTDLASSS